MWKEMGGLIHVLTTQTILYACILILTIHTITL